MNNHWKIISRRGTSRLVEYEKNGKLRKRWIEYDSLKQEHEKYKKKASINTSAKTEATLESPSRQAPGVIIKSMEQEEQNASIHDTGLGDLQIGEINESSK